MACLTYTYAEGASSKKRDSQDKTQNFQTHTHSHHTLNTLVLNRKASLLLAQKLTFLELFRIGTCNTVWVTWNVQFIITVFTLNYPVKLSSETWWMHWSWSEGLECWCVQVSHIINQANITKTWMKFGGPRLLCHYNPLHNFSFRFVLICHHHHLVIKPCLYFLPLQLCHVHMIPVSSCAMQTQCLLSQRSWCVHSHQELIHKFWSVRLLYLKSKQIINRNWSNSSINHVMCSMYNSASRMEGAEPPHHSGQGFTVKLLSKNYCNWLSIIVIDSFQ